MKSRLESDAAKPSDAVEAGQQDGTSDSGSDHDSVVFIGKQSVTADDHTAPSSEAGDEHESTGAMEESTVERLKASLHAVDEMEFWTLPSTSPDAPSQLRYLPPAWWLLTASYWSMASPWRTGNNSL